MVRLLSVLAFAVVCQAPVEAWAQEYDLIIRNCRILDGTGSPERADRGHR